MKLYEKYYTKLSCRKHSVGVVLNRALPPPSPHLVAVTGLYENGSRVIVLGGHSKTLDVDEYIFFIYSGGGGVPRGIKFVFCSLTGTGSVLE